MSPIRSDVRMLIAVRVVVVTSLLLAVMLVQFTANVILPITYLYIITAATYALTLLYIFTGRLIRSRTFNLSVQTAGDLLIETMLVYFTGGPDSPFSFLYLVSIITAAMLLYRRGGLITASGCVILYAGLCDLIYYSVLPLPPVSVFSFSTFTSNHLYVNLATNVAGFYATALLTSYVSEQLRKKEAELDRNRRSLAELQAVNQNVVESIPSGLLTVTRDGIVSFANPAATMILRRRYEELVGRRFVDIGLFTEEEWNRLLKLVTEKVVMRGEKEAFQRQGESVSIGYAVTPLNTLSGEPTGATLIFQDLTEVKRLEAQLRLKDRMAAVGELSAGIAHEIRNPLAAIAGSVQVLRNSGSLTPQEQRLMSIILKESDRLNKSIADFLQFVKPQERRSTQYDIAANLSETLELLSNSLELGKNHTIERVIEPSSFRIVGDPDQIRQVFWNIAKNAIQAMPEGGTLRISTTVEQEFFTIAFTDSGLGMTPDDQHRIFQPFRTNFPSGTGLGMAISYRIVQEHGGKIAVLSNPGEGTTITVSLPLLSSKAAQIRTPDFISEPS